MELFTITAQPGELPLYKGSKSDRRIDVTRQGPVWFGFDRNCALQYGEHVTRLTHGKPLRLLNISSWLFQHHFIDQLNLTCPSDADLRRKDLAVVSLGIPNKQFQQFLFNKHLVPPRPSEAAFENLEHRQHVVHSSEYFMGNRLSVAAVDVEMIKHMMAIYGSTHDGYIQQTPVSTIWMDRFHSELCLFHADRCDLRVVEPAAARVSRIPTSQQTGARGGARAPLPPSTSRGRATGGGSVPSPFDENGKLKPHDAHGLTFDGDPRDTLAAYFAPYHEQEARDMLLRSGYQEDELRYDEHGSIVMPSVVDRLVHEARAGVLCTPSSFGAHQDGGRGPRCIARLAGLHKSVKNDGKSTSRTQRRT